MTLLHSINNFILRVMCQAHRYAQIALSPTILEYAPNGWNTVLEQSDGGWNAESVVKTATAQWDEFCTRVSPPNPLGFYHEHDDLSINGHVPFHNINITFGYVLALVTRQKSKFSLLDYGGSLGHYYQIGTSLVPDIELDYHCKEFPGIAATGSRLNPHITWYTDDSCLLRSYDMVMISSSLQYMENWREFLSKIATVTVDYLYLTRINVQSSGPEFVTIQNAYNTQMLVLMFNREDLLQVVHDCGFSLMREFIMEECPIIKNAPAQCVMRGWLFRKTGGNNTVNG
jgi:putative methyltransferase (TIGR04325 family)